MPDGNSFDQAQNNPSTNDTCIIFVFPETRNPIWRKNEQKERYLKVFYTKCLIGKSRFPRKNPLFLFPALQISGKKCASVLIPIAGFCLSPLKKRIR